MRIEDLSKHSTVKDSGTDVSNGKVFLRNGYPHCKLHGAMNKVAACGIWRCLMCHVGCFELTVGGEDNTENER